MVQHWCGDFIGNLSQTILNTPQRLPVLLSDVPTIANRIAVNRVSFSLMTDRRIGLRSDTNQMQVKQDQTEFYGDYAQSFSEYQT